MDRPHRIRRRPDQDALRAALLSGASAKDAAAAAGCALRTAERWLQLHREELARARGITMDRAVGAFVADLGLAHQVLRELAANPQAAAAPGAGVRRAAASALVDAVGQLSANAQFESRVAALEALLEPIVEPPVPAAGRPALTLLTGSPNPEPEARNE